MSSTLTDLLARLRTSAEADCHAWGESSVQIWRHGRHHQNCAQCLLDPRGKRQCRVCRAAGFDCRCSCPRSRRRLKEPPIPPSTAPSVLYMLADDLRPELGFAGGGARTPHLDRFAAGSTYFSNTFAQDSFCVPSRTSFLTGLRPDRTGMVHNDMRLVLGRPAEQPIAPEMTVVGAFRAAGFNTAGVGKIFHLAEPSAAYTYPWLEGSNDLFERPCDEPYARDVLRPPRGAMPGWMGAAACTLRRGRLFPDELVARHATTLLRHLGRCWDGDNGTRRSARPLPRGLPPCAEAGHRRPFFLAVGFMRPHDPYQIPLAYLPADDAGEDAAALAAADALPRHAAKTAPSIAYPTRDPPSCAMQTEPSVCARNLRRFYRGAVAYLDAVVGVVLAALEDTSAVEARGLRSTRGLAHRTLVVMHADHGYSLGENGAWHKRNNFDSASRVPLFVRAPWLPRPPSRPDASSSASASRSSATSASPSPHVIADAVVELIDVLPTLLDLAGISWSDMPRGRPPLQGASLRGLLEGRIPPHQRRLRAAYMQQPRMSYRVDEPSSNSSVSSVGAVGGVGGGGGGSSGVGGGGGGGGGGGDGPGGGCSALLHKVVPPFSCRLVAMGYSVRTLRYRYTRWETWDETRAATAAAGTTGAGVTTSSGAGDPEALGLWAPFSGRLLAEELHNHTGDAGLDLSGAFEARNLAPPHDPATGNEPAWGSLAPLRDTLANALRTRPSELSLEQM